MRALSQRFELVAPQCPEARQYGQQGHLGRRRVTVGQHGYPAELGGAG